MVTNDVANLAYQQVWREFRQKICLQSSSVNVAMFISSKVVYVGTKKCAICVRYMRRKIANDL
jgi:hypothetical protein